MNCNKTQSDCVRPSLDVPPQKCFIFHEPMQILHSQYQLMENRFNTFEHWPKYLPGPSSKDLARAGFIYSQVGDKVKCFSCGVVLKDWVFGDDAFNEHLRWSSKCTYAKMVCG